MAHLSDLVVFADEKLATRHATGVMPMAVLLESYLDGALDIPNMDAFLDARHAVATFGLTSGHVKFLVTRMIPEWLGHTKAQDRRIVREHYDRGDDFFEAFLGPTMVYTGAFFEHAGQSLEQAQYAKIDRVCRKLRVRPGDEVLDIGCGWGTLVARAAHHFQARATGVTIARAGAAYGNARIERQGLADRASVQCLDYRDIPRRQYDRIVSLEMVEHVGIKNLSRYLSIVRDRLKDDGLFLLQWCGLRRGGDAGVPPVGLRPEDMVWGLFMNKYIFPGADASLPPSEMLMALEKAGFETQSVENVSVHYALTIQRWHDNWQRNRAAVVKSYGERWYRLWHLFLGWSWRIALQGSSACFQVVAYKNLDSFDRRVFLAQEPPSAPASEPIAVDSGVAAE
jgi:cyclopropane fatty-acyl-phospholipid synthase-like methyltransferase